MDPNYQNNDEHNLNTPAPTGVQQDLQLLPLRYLMARQFPPVEWLVDGLIPEDAVVLLSGAPASFKTWFALEVAKSVASGNKLLDTFPTSRANVLIMDAESGDRQLYDHFKKLHVDPDLGIYYSSCCGHRLNLDAVVKLEAQCYDNDIKLVIFDSLVRFHDGDENSAREMSKVFESFTYLKERGITSLIICHTRKSGNNQRSQDARNEMESIRGSSDILAACDIHLSVTRSQQGNQVTIRQTKNRFNTESKPFTAYFVKEGENSSRWYFGEIQETKEDIINRHKSLVLTCIQENPGKNQKQILVCLQKYDGSQIYNDKSLREPLRLLEKDGLIYSRHGKGKELLYYAATIAETIDNNTESQNV